MPKYRLLLALGFVGLCIVIADVSLNQRWDWLLTALIYNFVMITYLGNSIALHRYVCHRAFKTTAFKHRLLSFLSILPGHGSPIDFTILHRHHHAYSDQELDTHSPRHGFWHSWLIYGTYGADYYVKVKKVRAFPKDLMRDPTLKFIHKYYYHMMYGLIAASAIVNWRLSVYFVLLPIALAMWDNFYLSYTSHVKWFPGNYRNFELNDNSYNNKYVSLLHGDLHHNHHKYPTRYNEACMPGEFDLSGKIIDKLFVEHSEERQYKI